ncbi:MAG: hypothetical protein KDF60_19195, partial [Calditrichaeota bacterium]|nr:hypothetical protein [Calditrichota bacterium]
MNMKAILILITVAGSILFAQEKKQLDHDVYDFWNRPIQHAISDNGNWFLYAVKPDNGDGKLTFKNLQNETEFNVARGDSAAFGKNASFAAFLIRAKLDSVKKAKKDEKKGKDAPQDSLAVIDLSTGNISVKDVIKSYKMPEDAGGWLAWQLKFSKEPKDSSKAENDSAKTA